MKKEETLEHIDALAKGAAFKTRSLCFEILPELKKLMDCLEKVAKSSDAAVADRVIELLVLSAPRFSIIGDKLIQIDDWAHVCNSNQVIYRKVAELHEGNKKPPEGGTVENKTE